MQNINLNALAGIQYFGLAGVSSACKSAIVRLLQFGDHIHNAKLLTCSNAHCFLLNVNYDELMAIKSGFSSGYAGEGPSALSTVLQLLYRHSVDMEEYEVPESIIERIDRSCLTVSDLEQINSMAPVRPWRWSDYIIDRDNYRWGDHPRLRHEFPKLIPYAIIDARLTNLALSFDSQPDNSILSGYRKLEDIIRERTGLDEHGAKLFAKAFQGEDSILCWKGIDPGEQQGRTMLFTGTYMAFRNRRAHREPSDHSGEALSEFLQLNQLYQLERLATKREKLPNQSSDTGF